MEKVKRLSKYKAKLAVVIAIPCFLLILFVGCMGQKRVFTYTQDGMTNGEVDYIYMPDEWHYEGKFLFYMGRTEDGRPVYAADREGTIIRKKKKWYSDMNYRALLRADCSYPDIFSQRCLISLCFPKKGSYVEMSEEGGKEFQEVLEQLYSGKKVTSAPKVFTTGEKKTIVDGAHVENADFPNLIYIANIEVVLIDSRMYIWDQKNSYIEIDSSSVLYDEIMAEYNG